MDHSDRDAQRVRRRGATCGRACVCVCMHGPAACRLRAAPSIRLRALARAGAGHASDAEGLPRAVHKDACTPCDWHHVPLTHPPGPAPLLAACSAVNLDGNMRLLHLSVPDHVRRAGGREGGAAHMGDPLRPSRARHGSCSGPLTIAVCALPCAALWTCPPAALACCATSRHAAASLPIARAQVDMLYGRRVKGVPDATRRIDAYTVGTTWLGGWVGGWVVR